MGNGDRGFAYVGMIALLAVLGIGLAAAGQMWAEHARRERERELLRIGRLYAMAIARYYHASPGGVKHYPPSLDQLVLDTRFVGTMRHLRRAYADPIDPPRPWGVVRAADGGVRGVYSTSGAVPLRTEALDLGITALPAARRYIDWQFIPKVDP
jgi:type II secretory pathway pseudopilin PulG